MPPIEPAVNTVAQTTMIYQISPPMNHYTTSTAPNVINNIYPMRELSLPNIYQMPPQAQCPSVACSSHHVHQSQAQPQGYYLTTVEPGTAAAQCAVAGTLAWNCAPPYQQVYMPVCTSVIPPPSGPSVAPAMNLSPHAARITCTADKNAMPPTNPLMNSTNMEVVWHGSFDKLFAHIQQAIGHNWTLRPSVSPADETLTHCQVFKDSAKVRFLCKSCGNAWTSMKGRVIFWIRLDTENNSGTVDFKLFGQQCQKCMPGTFEHAMWYPEEVIKVVSNVYQRVGQLFYGFQQPAMSTARRTGKPRTQHNSKLCQACALNICRENFVAPSQQQQPPPA